MEPIHYAIVGGGWRSEFFIAVSSALAPCINVAGVVVRDAAKGALPEQKWAVLTYRTLDAMLSVTQPQFVLISVSKSAIWAS